MTIVEPHLIAGEACGSCPWPKDVPCGGAFGVCPGNAIEVPAPDFPILDRCTCGAQPLDRAEPHRRGGPGCAAEAEENPCT